MTIPSSKSASEWLDCLEFIAKAFPGPGESRALVPVAGTHPKGRALAGVSAQPAKEPAASMEPERRFPIKVS